MANQGVEGATDSAINQGTGEATPSLTTGVGNDPHPVDREDAGSGKEGTNRRSGGPFRPWEE